MFVSNVNECFFQVFADFTPTTVTTTSHICLFNNEKQYFASFARVFSFLYISLPFLPFPRREMMCFKFAVMWKT